MSRLSFVAVAFLLAVSTGCAHKGAKSVSDLVKLSGTAIKLEERVLFETGSAKIDAKSFELLDEVARVISANAQLKKIRVEGYTDNSGAADFNKKLSQDRAESVAAYIAGKGVAKDRLEAVGLGDTSPVATNDTEEGREQNRRVEFKIAQ
jgi:outer membrane protein OmpA-like peptidoglycan-associated protein